MFPDYRQNILESTSQQITLTWNRAHRYALASQRVSDIWDQAQTGGVKDG